MAAGPRQAHDLGLWETQYLQLVVFTTEPALELQQQWWRNLTGAEPESSRKRGQREEKGVFHDASFSVTTDLLRIIWIAGPYLNPAEPPEEIPFLGPFPEARGWFADAMAQWLAQCPPINRLGFAARLFHPTPNRDDSYRLLSNFLPAVEIELASQDFQYRINRRRQSASGIAGLLVNRLCTWSPVKYTLDIRPVTEAAVEPPPLHRRERYGCALDLDINTVPERTEQLPHDVLPRLFQELVEMGAEITQYGDIP